MNFFLEGGILILIWTICVIWIWFEFDFIEKVKLLLLTLTICSLVQVFWNERYFLTHRCWLVEFWFTTNHCHLFCVLQLAQRKIRDILTQVKQPQKGGMGMGSGSNPQGFTEMGSPTQGLTQDHQLRRKWGSMHPPYMPCPPPPPPPDGQTDRHMHGRIDKTDRRIQERNTWTQR